jgi:ring-1,2-phenylacetyl-CoA epoxidase subunit PaaE
MTTGPAGAGALADSRSGTRSGVPAGSPAESHAGAFHRLRVAQVLRLTDDSVRIEFAVPPRLREAYRFMPGQHLAVRTELAGAPVRRTYSICASPSSGRLQVAVKALPGGAFSELANRRLAVGDLLDVMTPAGRFGVRPDPLRAKRYVALAAGSGITPMMSVMPAVLQTEPGSSFVLVYGNRDSGSVMFVEEIADLKDRYPDRFQVLHVLSREAQDAELLTGRIDGRKLDVLLGSLIAPASVDEWLLCGPHDLVQLVQQTLADREVPANRVHRELFHVDGEAPRLARPRGGPADQGCQVTARLDGRSSTFAMPDEGSVLDATLAQRPDAPFACKGGVCGTCRIRVVEGTVRMDRNFALEPAEVAGGFALACQSVPTSPRLVVEFDA